MDAEMTDAVVRVLLVDDDALVRSALRMMLTGDGIEIVGEAENGRAACQLVEELRPDLVLMDIRMPEMDGLAATEHIRSTEHAPNVIMLTTFDSDQEVHRALRAGAAGFLLKDASPTDIVSAVRNVAAGDAQLSPSITRRLISELTATRPRTEQAIQSLGRLTAREREIAVEIGRGLSNADIATSLHLSVATVKAHVTAIFEKLEVTNRVQVALLVHDADVGPG